jgi:hypothetical protein
MALPVLVPLAVTAFAGSVSYISGKIVSDLIFKAVCWTFFVIVTGIYVSLALLYINTVFVLYHLVLDFISFVEAGTSNTGSGSFLNNFFGVVKCSGVLGGINAVKGMVLSAVSFRLLYALYRQFSKVASFLYFGFNTAIGARLT